MSSFDWEAFVAKTRFDAVTPQDALNAHRAVDEAIGSSLAARSGQSSQSKQASEKGRWVSGVEASQPPRDRHL